MELARIKRDCSDCKKTSRWAEVRSDFEIGKTTNYRIVSIGRKKIQVMSASGTIFPVRPEDVKRAW